MMRVRGDGERFHDSATTVKCSDRIGTKDYDEWCNSCDTNPASQGKYRHRNPKLQTEEYRDRGISK